MVSAKLVATLVNYDFVRGNIVQAQDVENLYWRS